MVVLQHPKLPFKPRNPPQTQQVTIIFAFISIALRRGEHSSLRSKTIKSSRSLQAAHDNSFWKEAIASPAVCTIQQREGSERTSIEQARKQLCSVSSKAYVEKESKAYSELKSTFTIIVFLVHAASDPLNTLLQRTLHPWLKPRGEKMAGFTDCTSRW